MKSKLGVHYIPEHGRPTDLAMIESLQPPVILVIDPDPQKIADIYAKSKNSLFLLRDWAMSEQHDNMTKAPVDTAKEHVASWIKRLADWKTKNLALPPDNQMVVLGINEPHVWEVLQATVDYNVEFLKQCDANNLRGGALSLGVGWPANTGVDTPVDWKAYESIHPYLSTGKNILVLHEYWSVQGPSQMQGWWANRFSQCPWQDVQIVIGECGCDVFVENTNGDANHRGWASNMSPQVYMQQLAQYDKLLMQDKRVLSGLVFTTDFASRNWASFDTDGIRDLWTTYNKLDHDIIPPPPPVPPVPPIPPQPVPVDETFDTTSLTSVNVRTGPGLSWNVLHVLSPNTPVKLTSNQVMNDSLTWKRYGNGWVATKNQNGVILFGDASKFGRASVFTLHWEGGYVNDPNDPGGETNFGISKRAYPNLDIAHLTADDALKIYYNDYWVPSGAEKLDWPLCLQHFDTSILCGIAQSDKFLKACNGSQLKYTSLMLTFLTSLATFGRFGTAWTRRVADVINQ